MKVALKSVLTLIVIPLAVAFAVEVLSPFAPETLPALQRWVAAVTEWAGFPWVFAGSLGLLIGMWLDRVAGAFDGRHPITRRAKLVALADKARVLAAQCRAATVPFSLIEVDTVRLRVDLLLFGKRLEALGIDQPYLPAGMPLDRMLNNSSVLLRAISPAMEEGNLEAVRYLASKVRADQISDSARGIDHD